MLDWDDDRESFLARVRARRAFLKIVLKTRNDPFFLGRWIAHHLRIAGPEGLVILDNDSTDASVLDTYARLDPAIARARFRGFHNAVHDYAQFGALYAALWASAEFIAVLDTDEFLFLVQEDHHHAGPEILAFLRAHRDCPVFPATWLHNVPGSEADFYLGLAEGRLASGLAWGKPVLRATRGLPGAPAHNVQLPKWLYAGRIRTALFLAHLTQLSPEQRVRANLQKLVARGFARPDETAEEIVARGAPASESDNIRLYIAELAALLPQLGRAPVRYDGVPAGCLRLAPDGRIEYHSVVEQAALRRFLRDGDAIARDVLGLPSRA